MEHASISLVLVIDKKDFEQACTVGHKKRVLKSSNITLTNEILLWVQVFGNLLFFYFSEILDTNSQKSSTCCVKLGKFFSLDLKHPGFFVLCFFYFVLP